jgi:hypothetical protein
MQEFRPVQSEYSLWTRDPEAEVLPRSLIPTISRSLQASEMEMCYQGRISIGGGLWEREPTGSSEGAAPAHVRALLGVRAPNRSRRRQSTTARGRKRRPGAARNRSAFLLVGSAGHRRSVIRRDAPAAPTPQTPRRVVFRAFDTAAACNDAQDQLRYRVSRLNLRVPVASAASEAAEFSQCIASDDPRLKGK